MGKQRQEYKCPHCLGIVVIRRNDVTRPYRATCLSCGQTWPYVQVQTYQGITTVMVSDFVQACVLTPV